MATINLSEYKELNISNIETFKVAIVVAEWNAFITENLLKGCEETLLKEGVKQENIKIVRVPGAFELSYASMQLCKSQKYDAVVAIGCVIRGETSHFDFVCSRILYLFFFCSIYTCFFPLIISENSFSIFFIPTELERERDDNDDGTKKSQIMTMDENFNYNFGKNNNVM